MRLFEGVFERENAGHLERQFVRIHFVERAVHNLHLDVNDLVARVNAALDGFLNAVNDRRDVFPGNRAADDFVFDLDALALLVRLNLDAGVAVLAATAGLADKFTFAIGGLGDGFPISDLRRAGVGVHLEFALEPVANDFQVQLAHACNDELAGFLVVETAERRVFLGQPLQSFGHFVAVSPRLRLDGHADNGLGERRRFKGHVVVLVAQRVAGGDIPQTDERGDVAGINLGDVLAFAALNNHQAADAIAFARAGIVNRVALFERAGINAEEHQFARVDVRPQLERERTKFIAVAGLDVNGVVRVHLGAFRAGNIQRTRQIIHDRVHQRLHALLFEGRTAQHGHQFNLARQPADGRLERERLNRLFPDHQFGNRIVLVGNGVNQFRECGFGFFLQTLGNFLHLVFQTFVDDFADAPGDRLLVDHVNDAFELVLGANRQINRIRIRAEFFPHVFQRVFKIRAGAVHLVDERDARNIVFGRLTPHRFGLRLNARDGAEHRHRAVQNAHGAFDFGGEIHVTGRVNDVDAMRHTRKGFDQALFFFLRPKARHRGGRDGDAAFAFLLHPVRDRVAIVHVADFVDEAGVKEDALGRRRLARVNVRRDADVARALQRVFAVGRIDRFRCFCSFSHLDSENKKRPDVPIFGARQKIFYQRKWANALFACAIL